MASLFLSGFSALLRVLLTLSLVIGTVTPLRAAASVETSDERVLQERLISEIDRQADQLFQELKQLNPKAPIGSLKKTQREIVLRMKQMGVFTDMLRASGKAPALTMLGGMLLVDLVIVPIVIAMGHPVEAGMIYAVPWGTIAGAGVFGYLAIKTRREIAKELNVSSLKQYDELRKFIVGYDIKNRVSTSILKSLDGSSTEFEILRKTLSVEKLKAPAISIPELEALVRAGESGSAYLESVFMQKVDPAIYSALLLRFITNDVELNEVFVRMMVERLGAVDSAVGSKASTRDQVELRQFLVTAAAAKAQIKKEMKEISKAKMALLKSRVKRLDVRGAESKETAARLSSEFDRLQELRQQVTLTEYARLFEAKVALSGGSAKMCSDAFAAFAM